MEFRDVDVLDRDQTGQLHELFLGEWWSRTLTRTDVERMLAHTDHLFGICEADSGRLVGFARVLSDRVTKALIFDVIVAPDQRRAGLGKRLLDRILAHPELRDVSSFELYCLPEMAPFYECLAFTRGIDGLVLMRRER